jgi:S-adenosylmethionine-diacylgycerolhomoserine-N-methlytransferase
MTSPGDSHGDLMDGVYRHQRHVYDLTRKYYLLGRDRLIGGLAAPEGGSVLEIGCGTGRNLIAAAQAYPTAQFFGLDISSAMLETAARAVAAEHRDDQITLALGDATAFDAEALFGRARFDRVFLSYAVSMIPGWEKAVEQAAGMLALGGSLHVVDFGQQEQLPRWFRSGLRAWLRRFHVEPRAMLAAELAVQAERIGGRLTFTPLYRGYAWYGVLTRPASLKAAGYSVEAAGNSAESASAIA